MVHGAQEEAEASAAAAERQARQLHVELRQVEADMQQHAADAQLGDHAATLRVSDIQHSYSK